MELERLSASEIGELVNKGEITPSEVINYFYDRIQHHNKTYNAFVYTRYEEAMEKAKEIEARLVKGENVGPFAGVPFGLKDFLPSKKGWTNSKGGVKTLIEVDDHDSVFCEAMEKAGGIALGKTNAPAYGFSGTTDNKLYGPTRNAFDTERNSGGSSGGSAVAVATGLIPIAEGGDAGGSIRIPASWNNLFGYKASVGTIPSVCRPDAWTATHPYCFNGGLTKTVQDAAILLNYMAKYDPRDPLSVERESIDYTKEMKRSIKSWKIAFTYDFGLFAVDSEIKQMVYEAAKKLEAAGASVNMVEFNAKHSIEEITEAWCESLSVDTAILFKQWEDKGFDVRKECKDEIPERFFRYNDNALRASLMDIFQYHVLRTDLYDAFQDIFDDYDLIISPVSGCLPVKNGERGTTSGPSEIDGQKVDPLIGFAETILANFTGHPAASVPVGLSKSGLPVGMQIIGKRFHDGDVLAASKTFEDISPWRNNFEPVFKKMS